MSAARILLSWWLPTILIVLVLLGGSLFWLLPRKTHDVVTVDDGQRWEHSEAPTRRSIVWKTPEQIEVVPADLADGDSLIRPHLADEEKTLYFTVRRADGSADIYRSRRVDKAWQAAEPVAELNSDHNDFGPTISADGQQAYLYSDRPGGHGSFDLYVSQRDGDTWTKPKNLGPRINTPAREYDPAPSPDGTRLFFSSNRTPKMQKWIDTGEMEEEDTQQWSATLRAELALEQFDLYQARRENTDQSWQSSSPVSVLNEEESTEGAASVSPSGAFVVFSSNRPNGRGEETNFDLYRARIRSDGIDPPENVGSVINTPANETEPVVSMEGFRLQFSSDRLARSSDDQPDHVYGLFVSKAAEIEEQVTWDDSNWQAFLAFMLKNWWWILIATLLAILLAVLIWLLRQIWLRKIVVPSIVVIALIALLIHLLGGAGSFWLYFGEDIVAEIKHGLLDIPIEMEIIEENTHQSQEEEKAQESYEKVADLKAIETVETPDVQRQVEEAPNTPAPTETPLPTVPARLSPNEPQKRIEALNPESDIKPTERPTLDRQQVALAEPKPEELKTEKQATAAPTPERVIKPQKVKITQKESPPEATKAPEALNQPTKIAIELPREKIEVQRATDSPAAPAPTENVKLDRKPTKTAPATESQDIAPDAQAKTAAKPAARVVTTKNVKVDAQAAVPDTTKAPKALQRPTKAAPSKLAPESITVERTTAEQPSAASTAEKATADVKRQSKVVETSESETTVKADAAAAVAATSNAPAAVETVDAKVEKTSTAVAVTAQPKEAALAVGGPKLRPSSATPAPVQRPVDAAEFATKSGDVSPTLAKTDTTAPADRAAADSKIQAEQGARTAATPSTKTAVNTVGVAVSQRQDNSAPSPKSIAASTAGIATKASPRASATSTQRVSAGTGDVQPSPSGAPVAAPKSSRTAATGGVTSEDITAEAVAPAGGSPSKSIAVSPATVAVNFTKSADTGAGVPAAPAGALNATVSAPTGRAPSAGPASRVKTGADTSAPSSAKIAFAGGRRRTAAAGPTADRVTTEAPAAAAPASGRPSGQGKIAGVDVGLSRSDLPGITLQVRTPSQLGGPHNPLNRKLVIGAVGRQKINAPLALGPNISRITLARARAIPTLYAEDKIRSLAARLVTGQARKELLKKQGGTDETEAAVSRGLAWTLKHQHPDGHWGFHDFHTLCKDHPRCNGQGSAQSNTAATGFALLPFLGHGDTHTKATKPEHQSAVKRGLDWLIKHQKPDGDLYLGNDNARMYSHGIATIALCEAYAMTKDPKLRDPAQRAINFIVKAQDKNKGGWRYQPGTDSDTSVVGWQLMALKSGEMANLNIPAKTFTDAKRYLRSAEGKGDKLGQFGYVPGQGGTSKPAMTSEALLCLEYLGISRNDPSLVAGGKYLARHLPGSGGITSYYMYYGTQVSFHMQGDLWNKWNVAMKKNLLSTQIKDKHMAGTWNPSDAWENQAGRLFGTSLRLLMLEIYYRHLPLYTNIKVE